MTCECHKINWLARVNPDKEYMMMDGSPLKSGVDCQDKVNQGNMNYDTYLEVCKYQPGTEGSLFPDEVFQILIGRTSSPVPPQTLSGNESIISEEEEQESEGSEDDE
jgi:hypothetical protein